MTRPRTTAVDLIRLAALFGICVVNLPFLGLPTVAVLSPPAAGADRLAWLLVAALFQSKFFLLFSFLFGWGFAVQLGAAARAGADAAARIRRRLLGLGLLGALHAVFVFTGDILVLYAVLGAALWPLRDAPVRVLLGVAAAMVPLALGALGALAAALGAVGEVPEPALGAGLLEATRGRLLAWPSTFGFLLLFQGPLAFGAFACGHVAARTGFFEAHSAGRAGLRRAAPALLGGGLLLNLGASLVAASGGELAPLALLVNPVAAPMLSAGWLHLLLQLDGRVRLPRLLALAGQSSLTAYVVQGVLAGLIFGGHGLGAFGSLGPAALLPLSVAVALASVVLTGLLARRSGSGPLERLLRAFTRGPAPAAPPAG